MIVQRYILGLALLGLVVAACGATEAEEGISPTLPLQPAVNEGSPSSLDTWPPSGAEAGTAGPSSSADQADLPTPSQADSLLSFHGFEVGDLAPAFVLPSSGGLSRSLEMLREDKNLVLVFYYAFW